MVVGGHTAIAVAQLLGCDSYSGRNSARSACVGRLARSAFSSFRLRIRSNVSAGSRISINLERGDECVIVEGVASELHEAAGVRRVTDAYNAKYSWNLEAKPGEFFEVRPRVVFAWLCDGSGQDGGALFAQTATRFLFG